MNFNESDEYDINQEDLDTLDFPSSESEDSAIDEIFESKNIDMKGRVDMINKRTKITKIKEAVIQAQEKYKRIKEELEICDNHILELKEEENMTVDAIEKSRVDGNIAALFRLQGQLKRVMIEQEGECDVRSVIENKMIEAEKELIKSQMDEGYYAVDEKKLKEDEEKYLNSQKEIQSRRVQNESKLTKNAQKSLEFKKDEADKAAEENKNKNLETQQKIADAHSKHSKFYQKTSKEQMNAKLKLKQIKVDEEKKIEKSLQKLNSDINQTKDNMTAINAKRTADKLKKFEEEKNLQLSTIEKGGNPKLELKKYTNNIKMLEAKEQMLANVKEGKLRITEKISMEDKNVSKKKHQTPYLFEEPKTSTKRPPKRILELSTLNQKSEDSNGHPPEVWETWDIRSSAGRSSFQQSADDNAAGSMFPNSLESKEKGFTNDDTEEDINAPEFQGMWNSTVAYKVPKDVQNLPIKNETASKMDQEIMQRVLNQLKENIVQPQVVGGKLFKGKSFQSKPEIIQFENLEVGEIYYQKVILTNTSYGINQCRFERISEHLMDFISIRFSPSGPLSPGMTIEFVVTFQPKLDQDLNGEVFFTSQSERFSIPLVCLTKKCKITIDKQLIKFDTSVIGETLFQSVLLKNSGAKGTFCRIKRSLIASELEVENKTYENKDLNGLLKDDNTEYECITTSLGKNKLWLEPYKEQEVIIQWSPNIAGDYNENFIISFEDEDNKGFDLQVIAKAIDVPVYIMDPVISMDICMMNRLYQDTIIFHSRAATALKLQFKIPEEIRDYLEILPNMGFIQAGQEFKAQLKLVVKSSIYKESCPFLDHNTGILDVPISASIANQIKTLDFNVQAVVTVTDLEIEALGSDPSLLDFGYCTINETKIKSLKLTNKSILSQEFGFTGYPDYVEIQPNHGYGVILPKEELEFHVLFSPKKAENFNFKVKCQTVIDRTFSLSCKGVGVHPSLELSNQIISFPYTAVNDMSVVEVFLLNKHVSTNIYTHEPPRIGTEPVISVGPKTYQFLESDDSDASIHPCVGTINPGEKQKLTIFFKPKLSEEDIKREASHIMNSMLEKEAHQKWEELKLKMNKQTEIDDPPQPVDKKSKKSLKKPSRPASEKRVHVDAIEDVSNSGPSKFLRIEPDEIIIDSDDYLKGKLSLLQKFDFNFKIIKIKCLIADGSMSDPEKLSYNSRNLLNLELHCPYVKPDLVLLSDSGRSLIDFGKNILNYKVTRIISLQNISSDTFQLDSTYLDPNGAFRICNALRSIEPNEVANIVIAFNANSEGIYETNWSIFGKRRNKMLKLKLRAIGITPKLEIKELKEGILNVGTVMVNEFVEKQLTLVNDSSIDILYKLDISSAMETSTQLGVHNLSGLSPFTVTPQSGAIAAGKSQIVTVTFAPDHESSRFKVLGSLLLFEKVQLLKFFIQGESKSNILYLKSINDPTDRPLEYLGEPWAKGDQTAEDALVANKNSDNIVLILQSTLTNDGIVMEGKTAFIIGCVKTMAVSQKKNGEFSIDNMNILTPLGFTVDSVKGQVEADGEKEVTVSWIPNQQYEMGSVISAALNVTLKGDVSSLYVVQLRAYVK